MTWVSGNLYHIAWASNYTLWKSNPTRITPISHSIWDPHFGFFGADVFSVGYSDASSTSNYSGIYPLLYTIGLRNEHDIYELSLAFEILGLLFISIGYVHSKLEEACYGQPNAAFLLQTSYTAPGMRLNYHTGSLIGLTSVLWSIHIISVALPASRGHSSFDLSISASKIFSGDWISLSLDQDGPSHIFGTLPFSGSCSLTFIGGTNPVTQSLYLSDIAHHHLALGVLLLWTSSLYSTLFRSLGHKIRNIAISFGSGSTSGLYPILSRSLDLELSISLIIVSQASSYTAQHMYSLSPYVYLSMDYVSVLSLYSHHTWISSFCLVGSMVHGSIFLLKDYNLEPTTNSRDLIYRILSHKHCIISHLSWVSLWLGFHTLLIFTHNEALSAFGSPEKTNFY